MKSQTKFGRSQRVAAGVLVALVGSAFGTNYVQSDHGFGSRGVKSASAAPSPPSITGSPFGPASRAASRASRALMGCFTRQGATAVPMLGGGIGVGGVTDAIRQACSVERDAMQAAQADPDAVREREAFFRVLADAQACSFTRLPTGFQGRHDTDQELVASTMRECEDEAFRAHGFTRADVPTP